MLEEYRKKLSTLEGDERAQYKAMMFAHAYGGNHKSLRDSPIMRTLVGDEAPRKFHWGIDPYKPEVNYKLLLL